MSEENVPLVTHDPQKDAAILIPSPSLAIKITTTVTMIITTATTTTTLIIIIIVVVVVTLVLSQ